MREIKFRAWDKDTQKMFYDVSIRDGSFCVYRNIANLLSISGKICEQSSIVIEQFTGLKDKNGEECFAGDKVKLHTEGTTFSTDQIGRIECDEGRAQWIWKSLESVTWLPLWQALTSFRGEIIGNIHETSELLNERTKKIAGGCSPS